MNARTRLRRICQFEALEDRRSCSVDGGAVVLLVPVEPAPGTPQVQVRQDRGQGLRDAAARRRIDRALSGLDRAIADLARAVDRLELSSALNPAVGRGFHRANARVNRALAQLERALGARPQVVQATDVAAVQRAFEAIGLLETRALQLLQRPIA